MAKTIQQIQDMITAKYDAREIINEIADYLQANSGGGFPQDLANVLIQGNDAGGVTVENLADPTNAQDAATKKYVDDNAGGGGVQSVTYAELVALIGSSSLTAGSQYLITDYATKHFIVGVNDSQSLSDIVTGVNEPLLVTANSINTIDKNAKSALHPEDIIHYDWNPDNWLDDVSFADLSGSPVIVTGFKGVIYFRHDTIFDNYMGYDFRNCKFRRWKTDVAAWDGITTYGDGDFINHNSAIYQSLVAVNLNNEPALGSNFWLRLLDLSITEYWINSIGSSNGINAGSDFIDVNTFAEGTGDATYEKCCRNNHFEPYRDDNTNFEQTGTILSNNVFFLQDTGAFQVFKNKVASGNYGNTSSKTFRNNIIAGDFYENMCGDDFRFNIIGEKFYKNTVDKRFQHNVISTFFHENNVGAFFGTNTIGNEFALNKGCYNFHINTVGNDCSPNTFGGSNFYNTIANEFVGNRTGENFQLNTIQDKIGTIDYTSATHVYADYNTTIFRRADGAAKLSYFDNSDVLTVANANA